MRISTTCNVAVASICRSENFIGMIEFCVLISFVLVSLLMHFFARNFQGRDRSCAFKCCTFVNYCIVCSLGTVLCVIYVVVMPMNWTGLVVFSSYRGLCVLKLRLFGGLIYA